MRLREPRLRDETGAEIDMTTGERKSTVVSVRADRLFPDFPVVVTGMEVNYGPLPVSPPDPPGYAKMPDLVAAWVERDVVPLSGATKCARYPALPCPHDCEFGISGPCILDSEDV